MASIICMDAPPDKMSVAPYLKVQKLFNMLNVPQVLHVNEACESGMGYTFLRDSFYVDFFIEISAEGSITRSRSRAAGSCC